MQTEFGYYEDGTPTPTTAPTTASTSTLSPLQLTMVTTSTPSATPEVEVEDGEEPPVDESSVEEPPVEEPPVEEIVVEEPAAEEDVTPTATVTPYTYESYLEAVDEFLEAVEETKLNEEDLRSMIRSRLLRDEVYKSITADVPLVADKVWARHILVEDEETALEVLERLDVGEDWYALAAEYSTDESNKYAGGDLGWFGLGQMVADFEKVAFNLSVGQTSEPVATEFGYHIIQVLGHEEKPLSASELQTAKDEKFNAWLDSAISAEDVVRHNELWMELVPEEPTLYEFFQASVPEE
jgi:hypothetical protein